MKAKKQILNYKHIFFVGIGGISMSALAQLCMHNKISVSGSDTTKNALTQKLYQKGARIFYKHSKHNIKNCDLVVYSAAIKQNNPELIFAKQNKIKVVERSQFLGEISSLYQKVIAISGTHGKTTTTAMISAIFLEAGKNPTIHIGGEFGQIGGNIHCGCNKFFITEACEYANSFLELKPTISVITNIEPEHLDFFKDFNKEICSFNYFCKNTKKICYINENHNHLMFKKNIETFGLNKKSQFYAKNLVCTNGCYAFDCYYQRKKLGAINLQVEGKFNVFNALSSICVATYFKIPFDKVSIAINSFTNVSRRFQVIGSYKGAIVVHDYAHHPTEIRSVLQTCYEKFNRPIICVFQPHTYSRTKMLLNSFLGAFDVSSTLIIAKTYSAREKFDKFGSAKFLKNKLKFINPKLNVMGDYPLRTIMFHIKKLDLNNKVLLFLGAGDIEKIANKLKSKNKI